MRSISSNLVVIEDDYYIDKRIDQVLSDILEMPRNQIQHHISGGFITVNDKKVKKNYRLKAGDKVRIEIPPPKENRIEPVDADIEVIYLDDEIVVVDKPPDLVVHPGAAREERSVLSALKYRGITLSTVGEPLRGGVVHRIDKNTSGVIVLARTARSHFVLAKQFFSHTIDRKYIGIVEGHLRNREGVVEMPIGRHPVKRKEFTVTNRGKEAKTYYRVIRKLENGDLVMFKLFTGRTHQIRVHMRYLNHPLIGDPVYSSKKHPFMTRQALHAFYLGFVHPSTGELMCFYSKLPDDMRRLIRSGG